jgi:hypothetical protein
MGTRFYSSVEYGASGASSDPEILYYNASVFNNNTSSDGIIYDDPQVNFTEVRQYPLLADTSDYLLSVIRFNMNGSTKNLPMWIPRIVPNQANVNLTVYQVGVRGQINIGGIVYPAQLKVNLLWNPEVKSDYNVPPSPVGSAQNLSTDYYYGYSYQNFTDMVNTAVTNAMTNAIAQMNATYGLTYSLQSRIPNLTYNPTTGLFSWAFDSRFWGNDAQVTGVGSEAWQLFTDENLTSLITNFWTESYYNSSFFGGQFNGFSQVLIVKGHYDIVQQINPATGIPYTPSQVDYVITEDAPSTSGNWSPVDAIVITTSMIPSLPEQVAPPAFVGESNNGTQGLVAQAAFQQIIADISIPVNNAQDWRQAINYVPTAEYRMTPLSPSRQPLQQIDFQVWWRNRLDNNLYPLRVYNGSSVSLKMMFRKKQLGV